MAFWKNALATLGMVTTLFASPNIMGNETKTQKKAKIEQKLEEKLNLELNIPRISTSKGLLGWTILESYLDINTSIYFKLPNGLNFNLNGDLSGRGFKWELGKKDFSYNGMPILGYFKSLGNIQGTYMDQIKLGGMNLESFLDLFNSEKEIMGDAILNNIAGFKKDVLNIYSDKNSEEFIYDLIVNMISGNLDKFLDQQGITNEQKKQTKDAVEDLLNDLDYVFDKTQSDDIIKDLLYSSDPFEKITLKNRSLRDIINIAEGFGNLMNVKITDDYLKANMKLQGKGKAEADASFSYKVKLDDQIKNFNHILSSEYRGFGEAIFNLKLNFKESIKLSEFFKIDPLLVILYDLSDIDIRLKDLNLNSNLNIKSEVYHRITEAFELSEDFQFGERGFGIIYEQSALFQEKNDIELNLEFKTSNLEMDADYKELQKSMSLNKEKYLIYVFSKENQDSLWYFASLGLEINNEKYTWLSRRVSNNLVRIKGDKKEKDFGLTPKINLVLGTKGNIISPFVSFKNYPSSSFKAGALLDIPYITTKISLEHIIEDQDYNRLLIHPFNPDFLFTMEASSALFDKTGKNKIEQYFIQTEQIDTSPLPGKKTSNDKALTKLYSNLDGVLLNMKFSGSKLSVNSIYCADSSFFVGGGYFSDVLENLHGVDFTIGYEDLLFKARYGYANTKGHYSHLANISIGGSIHDLFIINLDLRALLLNDSAARYEGVHYGENDIQASIKLIGHF